MPDTDITQPGAIHHVRLTVTDITRSKDFYHHLLGTDAVNDFSDQVDDPEVRADPQRFFGGCAFPVGEQLLGLRPVAAPGDRFDSTRVGLDHVSLAVGSVDQLRAAAQRLTDAGIEHGDVQEMPDAGMAILSVQDPDDVNLELMTPLPG